MLLLAILISVRLRKLSLSDGRLMLLLAILISVRRWKLGLSHDRMVLLAVLISIRLLLLIVVLTSIRLLLLLLLLLLIILIVKRVLSAKGRLLLLLLTVRSLRAGRSRTSASVIRVATWSVVEAAERGWSRLLKIVGLRRRWCYRNGSVRWIRSWRDTVRLRWLRLNRVSTIETLPTTKSSFILQSNQIEIFIHSTLL